MTPNGGQALGGGVLPPKTGVGWSSLGSPSIRAGIDVTRPAAALAGRSQRPAVDAIGEVRVSRRSGSAARGEPGAGSRRSGAKAARQASKDPHGRPQSAGALTSADLVWAPFVALVGEAPITAFVKDPDGRYVYVNPYLLATLGDRLGRDWHGKTDADIWPPDVAAMVRANDEAMLRSGTLQLFTQAMPIDEGEPHTFLVMKFPLEADDGRVYIGGIGVDHTAHLRIATERDRLATAVEQASEAVVIADLDARITYVNPAFELVTGYSRNEVIGQNPRIINSGVQPRQFYEAMWAALTSGLPWVSDFVNRRKDGSLFIEEAVISPIRDASGAVTSYVAVKRDVTRERALEERSAQLTRERALIGDTLRGLRAGESPEATAQAICRQLLSLSGVKAAQLFIFELGGHAMTTGFAVAAQPDPPLRVIGHERALELRARAAQGPWVELWHARPSFANYAELRGLGLHLVGCAPMRWNGELIGLLTVDGDRSVDEAAFTELLAAIVEFADLAAAVIGRDVADRTESQRALSHIRNVIDTRAFHPVFQPVVDLATDAVVGYEALTRFADGVGPDPRFREAIAIGLGQELEEVTVQAALAAADGLPKGAWLSINVSPAMIVAGRPLRSLVTGSKHSIVLEVTEHAEIPDYEAFREAVKVIGPRTRLAVDDAGAGFASLRHILELRPAFVKLDRSLVAGLEGDQARQAMIVGLTHFARSVGCGLIAEGVETRAEIAALRALEVTLGQGFILGRPLPLNGAGEPQRG